MLARILICVILGSAVKFLHANYPLNLTCSSPKAYGGRGTCGPTFCTDISTTRTCSFTAATINYATYVKQAACKVCTQSTDSRCTMAGLMSRIKTNGGIKAAYCNDKYFVMHTSGYAGFPGNEQDIPTPPGGTDSSGACVTRNPVGAGYFAVKFPLTPTLLPNASRYNNINPQAYPGGAGDNGYLSGSPGVYGLPSRGAVGFTVAGQEIYPVYNNRASYTPENCEVDSCNEHVGQGGGWAHLHGDPFGPTCLYSAANYSSLNVHPPLIGFANDGVDIYGRYLSVSAPGYSTTLDVCGGHIHDSYPYHYHTQVITAYSDDQCSVKSVAVGTQYPVWTPGPFQCWRGNVSAISNFWSQTQNRLSDNAPCCGSTAYYAASGITIDGAGTAASPTAAPITSPVSPQSSPTTAPNTLPVSPQNSPTATPQTASTIKSAAANNLPTLNVFLLMFCITSFVLY